MAATIAVLSSSDLFTKAHQLAKVTRDRFASYREAFAAALREGHKAVKKMQQIVADKLRSIVRLPRIIMTKSENIERVAKILVGMGGSRWTKAGHDRVYFNNANEMVGIETTYYKTGNLSSVKIKGEFVSNCKGRKLIGALNGAYVDLTDNSIHYRGTCFSEAQFLRDDFESKIAAAIA